MSQAGFELGLDLRYIVTNGDPVSTDPELHKEKYLDLQ